MKCKHKTEWAGSPYPKNDLIIVARCKKCFKEWLVSMFPNGKVLEFVEIKGTVADAAKESLTI